MAINPSIPRNPTGGATCPIMPCPRLDIEILEIEWLGGHQTARENITITAPHWRAGSAINPIIGIFRNPIDFINNEEDVPALFHYATGARRAAVYEISSSATFTNPKVKVKLKTVVGQMFSQSDVGQAMTLEMSLETLNFTETSFNLPALNTTIELELALSDDSKNTVINTLQAIAGDATWTVTSASKCAVLKQTTRLEVFFIYAEPATFYSNGVWVEALRFLFRNAGIQGDSAVATTASKIASYCHSGHGLVYDTVAGDNKFVSNHAGGDFSLREYLTCSSSIFPGINIVNCYDQAGAVQVFCGAVGIDTKWIFMEPYGFINTTDLVGIGGCNNPFHNTTDLTISREKIANMYVPIVIRNGHPDTDTGGRSSFGNHAFVLLTSNDHIIDACAGPALGTHDLSGYANVSIDATCSLHYYGGDGAALALFLKNNAPVRPDGHIYLEYNAATRAMAAHSGTMGISAVDW